MNIDGKDIDVRQIRNDWAMALMTKGVVVKLAVSRWRATAPLKPEELGLKFANEDTVAFMKKYVRLGNEKLLPPQVINEIATLESKARMNLHNHSFSTIWGNFVPYTAFSSWESEDKKIREEFMVAASRLGQRYEEIISIVKHEYRKMAEDVWLRLYPTATGGATESFIENFVSNIISKIPSKSDIIASFKYDVTYFIIPMPSFVEQDLARVKDIQLQSQAKEYDAALERQIKDKIAQEYILRKTELIDGFLQSTVEEMREEIAKLCDNILQSIGQQSINQEISKTQIDRVKKMVKKVRLLNFYDDKKIHNLLSELETEVMKPKGDRNKNIIVDKLRMITEVGSEEFTPEDFSPTIGYLAL